MTWHTTTTEKPANSVDVLGWTGEKYVVASYDAGNWIAVEEDRGRFVWYFPDDYITHWTELPEAPLVP
jgi:hypothetical protein